MAADSNTTPVPKVKKRKTVNGDTPSASTSKLPLPSSPSNGEVPPPKKRKKDKTKSTSATNGHVNGDDISASVTLVDTTPTPKAKGKAKATTSSTVDDDFRTVRASVVLSLPPLFASDLRAGAAEMLDSLLMRYVPALGGVVLSHSDLSFPGNTAQIKNDCPFAIVTVHFSALTWAPAVGMTLRGKLSLSSPDHVALLVHRTFNASIPRHHLPADIWVFEHGPAENDPEFGWGRDDGGKGAEDADADSVLNEDGAENVGEGEEAVGGGDETVLGGRWVHSTTGEPLGGSTGIVEFTVAGMTAAHRMLSLLGSLQPDPFNPAHTHDKRHSSSAQEGDEDEGVNDAGDDEMEREVSARKDLVYVEVDDADSAVGDDDGDAVMGREDDDVPLAEAVAQEAEELARREAIRDQERAMKQKQQEREEKRKRKEERKKAKADAGVEVPAAMDAPKPKKRKTKPDA